MNQRKQLGTGLENRSVRKARGKGLEAEKQPLSGILEEKFPNDVTIENGLAECKVRGITVTQSGHRNFALDMAWIDRVEANAKRLGMDWGIVILNEKGSRRPKVLLDLDTFLTILAELKQLRRSNRDELPKERGGN